MERYDRQVRLWGVAGQQGLGNGSVLIVGDLQGGLCQEVMKNLALLGIGKISLTGAGDCRSGAGKFFGANGIESLNHDVEWEFLEWDGVRQGMLMDLEGDFWSSFSIVVMVSCDKEVLGSVTRVWERCFKFRPLPVLVIAHSEGLYGYVRLVSNEVHCVVDVHSQHFVPNLKLDVGWPELDRLCESIDFAGMDENELSEVPFAVLLRIVVKMLLSSNATRDGGSFSKQQIKDALIKLHQNYSNESFIQDLNFLEAERYYHLTVVDSHAIPEALSNIINSIPDDYNNLFDKFNRNFWVLIGALKRYLNMYKELPLPGLIPDMESNTERYIQLKKCYKDKSKQDVDRFVACLEDCSDIDVKSMAPLFCENVQQLRTVDFSKLVCPEDCLNKLGNYKHDSAALLAVLIVHQYDLKYTLNSSAQFNYADSIKKLKSKNLYPTNAFIGGFVSQEVMKLLTHQYVPLENTFVFDGLQKSAESFRL
ncbi:Ula1p Ecym_7323 [Eremothecium cymbalariae DBVPG|uniref:NEDD8-activating enzyme E1 regulatory subunit n=1 Tax=Eremothecium cymbalariae (strain CBS 270.75 / DBVPG 7215 / KCTC 17166 / NRRL Y-17582) TaxID=931890 RepID=G8JWE2_ERECY|nr:hypothetical protein Ecym_7323 [Eremothecium cymbalariae DBVPG\